MENNKIKFCQSTIFKILLVQIFVFGIVGAFFAFYFTTHITNLYLENRIQAEEDYFFKVSEAFNNSLEHRKQSLASTFKYLPFQETKFKEFQWNDKTIQLDSLKTLLFLPEERARLYPDSLVWFKNQTFSGLQYKIPLLKNDSLQGAFLIQEALFYLNPLLTEPKTKVDSIQWILTDNENNIISPFSEKDASKYLSVVQQISENKDKEGKFFSGENQEIQNRIFFKKFEDYTLTMVIKEHTMFFLVSQFKKLYILFSLFILCGIIITFAYLFRQFIIPLFKVNKALTKIMNNSWQGKLEIQTKCHELKRLFQFLNLLIEIVNKNQEQQTLHREFLEQEVRKRTEELETVNKHLREMSQTDDLTKLPNRRDIFDKLSLELSRSKRFKEPFSVLMLDIDFFKKINDTYGHLAGDFILKSIAEKSKKLLREYDYVARYGGEEFLIILPKTEESNAVIVGERFRKNIEETEFLYKDLILKITVSIGIIEFNTSLDFESNLRIVDKALYKSKKTGRNKITLLKADA